MRWGRTKTSVHIFDMQQIREFVVISAARRFSTACYYFGLDSMLLIRDNYHKHIYNVEF